MGHLRPFFWGFKEGFRAFGHTITSVINGILMFLVYVFFVGPTSIAAKAARRRFLDVSNEKKASYWEVLNLEKEDKDKYYDQF